MEKNEELALLLKRITIDKLDNISVCISNKQFQFAYNTVDVLKDEYKDKCRYFGGLQCNYEQGSEMYKLLEDKLVEIAEAVLKIK